MNVTRIINPLECMILGKADFIVQMHQGQGIHLVSYNFV